MIFKILKESANLPTLISRKIEEDKYFIFIRNMKNNFLLVATISIEN